MISIQPDRVIFICDACGKTAESDGTGDQDYAFKVFWPRIKRKKWKTWRNDDGAGWQHACPDCPNRWDWHNLSEPRRAHSLENKLYAIETAFWDLRVYYGHCSALTEDRFFDCLRAIASDLRKQVAEAEQTVTAAHRGVS
jgi:hypothetical protein